MLIADSFPDWLAMLKKGYAQLLPWFPSEPFVQRPGTKISRLFDRCVSELSQLCSEDRDVKTFEPEYKPGLESSCSIKVTPNAALRLDLKSW